MRLSEAKRILADAGIPDSAYDAREIFAEIGGIGRAELLALDPSTDSVAVAAAVARRALREPLQYIVGKAYFYREEYEVTPACLIPRQDTEMLVEYACRNIPNGERFIDLCTGSGCVGISTLKNTEDTVAHLVDISSEALDIAKRNAEANGVFGRCIFSQYDVLSDTAVEDCSVFAVLSNPPYVRDDVYGTLEAEIGFEPKIAFVGGEDGADFYRKLTSVYKSVIKDDGFIAYEIGYDQADILKDIADSNGMTCRIIKDLGGNDRVAVLRKKN